MARRKTSDKSIQTSVHPVASNSDSDGLVALSPLNKEGAAQVAQAPEDDPRRVLTEEEAYAVLGFNFPVWKKWWIITSVFIVQLSMNFNAAIYGSAVPGFKAEFGTSHARSMLGMMVFLILYAFGCELWAPWSEELGRWPIMQASLSLVNVWQFGNGFARSFTYILVFRALGGLSSAGGSVTLGMVADMWEPEDQQYAVAYVVLSSVAGSVIAPIAGGFIQTYLPWEWVFWISLIFGAVAQLFHAFTPETRASVLLDREAKRRRKLGRLTPSTLRPWTNLLTSATGIDPNIYGPNEIEGPLAKRIFTMHSLKLMFRPYKFLGTEPIVLFLSLLSGFADALIYVGLESFGLVMGRWNFTAIQTGLSFISILLGYIVAYAIFMPRYYYDRKMMQETPDKCTPERRLWLLLWLGPLMPIGLLIWSFGAFGPPDVHWIVPLIGAFLIGVANFAIYMATIDYMIAAYGPFAASATGGNGFCRDLLAGVSAPATRPLYENIANGTKWQLTAPSLILTAIGVLLTIPVYVFYYYGAWFRKRSPYAQELEQVRAEKRPQRKEAIAGAESRKTTPTNSRPASRSTSPTRVVDRNELSIEPIGA